MKAGPSYGSGERIRAVVAADTLALCVKEAHDLETRVRHRALGCFMVGIPRNEIAVEHLLALADYLATFRIENSESSLPLPPE